MSKKIIKLKDGDRVPEGEEGMSEKIFLQKGSFCYVVVDSMNANFEVVAKSEQDEQIKLLREALEKIHREHHDDKTHIRYIESLKKWETKVCKISFEALKKLGEMK